MESSMVGVVAAGGRGRVGGGARVAVKTVATLQASTAKAGGVDEAKVIQAFGEDHGFPVRGGKVAWSAMTETLEQLRQDALAADVVAR